MHFHIVSFKIDY